MKKLLLSTAILGASALPALAQQGDVFRQAPEQMEIRASDFMGMRVYASEAAVEGDEFEGIQEGWEDIGEINDLVLSRDGDVQAVVVDIGGFLGLGERRVAVSMDALRFVSDSATAEDADDFFLVMNADRAAIEGAPEYTLGDMDADEAAAATGEAMEDGAEAVGDAAEGTVVTVVEGGETVAEETGEAMSDAGAEVADETTDAAEEVTEEVDQVDMTDTQEDVAEATDESQDANEEMAEDAAGGEVVGGEVAEGDMNGMNGTMIEREGFVVAPGEMLTADRLQGAGVLDANEERVGEISELLLTDDGQIERVVVDIGGFLGIGEKPVALPMDQVQILQQEGGEEIRVYLPQSREQLDAMDRYEAE